MKKRIQGFFYWKKAVLLMTVGTLGFCAGWQRMELRAQEETAAGKVETEKQETRTELVLKAEQSCTAKELQELLNYNQEGQYDLTVMVPAGTYELDRQLVIYSHTKLISDKDSIYLRINEKYSSLIGNQYASITNKIDTVSEDIVIDGGVWDGNHDYFPHAGESICFTHARDIVIKNAVVCNVTEGSHLITFGGVENGRIENCEMYGYHGTLPKEAVHLDIVHSKDQVPVISPVDQYDDAACINITVADCTIYDYPRGVGSHTAVDGVYHHDVTVENNNFYDIAEEAVKAYQYIGLTVKNNTMKKVGLGICCYTWIGTGYLKPLKNTVTEKVPDSYDIEITGNTVTETTGTGTSGYGIRLIGSEDRPLSGITISNNKITDVANSAVYGIRLAYCTGAQVRKNTISNSANGGITLVNCSSCKLSYNKIKNTARYGIYTTESPKSYLYANQVSATGETGILINNSSTSSTVRKNKVWSTGKYGIEIYTDSNSCKVYDNTVRNTTEHGIFIYKADNAVVKTNIVKDSKADGIHIGTSQNTKAEKNTVSGSKGNAVTVTKQAAGCNMSTTKK